MLFCLMEVVTRLACMDASFVLVCPSLVTRLVIIF